MTQPLPDEIKRLAEAFPEPSEDKMNRRMGRLQRMANFYEEKIPVAPPKQSLMFTTFVSALLYAMDIIRNYQKLTRQLAELAERDEK